jgi:hypothetical protein
MVIKNIDFEKYNKMAEKSFYRKLGKVVNVVGLTIESAVPNSCFACVSIFSLIFRMFCREYLNLAIYLTPDLRTALPASVRSLQR